MKEKERQNTHSRQALIDLSNKVWGQVKKELFMAMRYMFAPLNALKFKEDSSIELLATDGKYVYYNPMLFIEAYKISPRKINRAYLHMVLHCMFLSLFKIDLVEEEDKDLWDLAADIEVENIIDEMELALLMEPISYTKEEIYTKLHKKVGLLNAENIFDELKNMSEKEIVILEQAFKVDDHRYWRKNKEGEEEGETSSNDNKNQDSSNSCDKSNNKENDRRDNNKESWQQKSAEAMAAMSAFGISKEGQSLSKKLRIASQKNFSYKKFLEKFMRIKEENKVDLDSFDYAYYHYGLSLDKEMPLIAEMEIKEEKLLEDFFIVIDSSGSCADGQIEEFLEETKAILSSDKLFSKNANIHILFADNKVNSDICIKDTDLSTVNLNNLEVDAYGGTDFRPAFKYVREYSKKNSSRKVSGLLYFTDGYGIYPKKRPDFKTAFVFTREPDFEDQERLDLVKTSFNEGGSLILEPPAWAIRQVFEKKRRETYEYK